MRHHVNRMILSQLAQNLFPPGVLFLLQVVDISIYFNDQICLVANGSLQ